MPLWLPRKVDVCKCDTSAGQLIRILNPRVDRSIHLVNRWWWIFARLPSDSSPCSMFGMIPSGNRRRALGYSCPFSPSKLTNLISEDSWGQVCFTSCGTSTWKDHQQWKRRRSFSMSSRRSTQVIHIQRNTVVPLTAKIRAVGSRIFNMVGEVGYQGPRKWAAVSSQVESWVKINDEALILGREKWQNWGLKFT